MTFYMFNCSTDKSLNGVTDDPIGVKLPRLRGCNQMLPETGSGETG
jgi:hypothetical protein